VHDGWAYENTCRTRTFENGWRSREHSDSVRVRLDDDRIELVDDNGVDLSQTPAHDMGDPILLRRDGVIAYQLAAVVDDHDEGITDVVRGRDIVPSTATQVLMQRMLGFATPRYRHHFLLLEPHGDKLAKLHGSIPFSQLRTYYDGPSLCGALAHIANLVDAPNPTTPHELVAAFDWSRVPREDRIVRWDDGLVIA
jgi:glutamyl/glutaminyl-tRNA synthetase